jgi:hypothetical protein
MKQEHFPQGWTEDRFQRIIAHYENQTDEEAVGEDEAFLRSKRPTKMDVPVELVPVVREIIARYCRKQQTTGGQ